VTDLIKATPEDDILRRDINDRPPIFSWCQGRVALLGDSAHAMQPNLGQGGCMAIEDAFQLGVDMGEALDKVRGGNTGVFVVCCLGMQDVQMLRVRRCRSGKGLGGM
jgi:zeaxanthin epoxidase